MEKGKPMSSSTEFVEYIMDQLSDVGRITCKRMFGAYGLFCNGRHIAFVCDGELLMKVTGIGLQHYPELPQTVLFEGAKKKYFRVEDVDDREMLTFLAWAIYDSAV